MRDGPPVSSDRSTARERPLARAPRSLALGFVASAAVLAAGGAAQAIAWNTTVLRSYSLYAGFLAVAIVLALRPSIDAFARRWNDGGPAAVWLGIAGGAVGLCAGLSAHFSHVMTTPYRLLHPYNSFWEMEPEVFLAPVLAFLVGAGWFVARGGSLQWSRARTLRSLAITAAVLSAALAGGASYRAMHAATMDRYLDSLPVVGASDDISARASDLIGDSPDGFSRRYVDTLVGPWVLRRYLFESGWHCPAALGRSDSNLPTRIHRPSGALAPCTRVLVRRDDRHQLVFVHGVSANMYDVGPMVFDSRTLAALEWDRAVNASIADGLTVPWSWIVATWALVAAAIAVMSFPSRAMRWLAGQSHWRAATLGTDRVIRFDDDGSSVPCPADSTLAAGPLVVFDVAQPAPRTDPFRAGARPSDLRARDIAPGPISRTESALLGELGARDALALAVAFAAASMLGAAALNGLVF